MTGLRVRTAAERTVLDDGAEVWRACVRLTVEEPGGSDEEYVSDAAYGTEAAALAAARTRADEIMATVRGMGAKVVCTHCGHLAHVDLCSCGCPARRAL